MLEAACHQLRAWSDALPYSGLYLTVNLTPRQFQDPALVAQLTRALVESGADPSRLVLEVPESALNLNPDAAIAVLQRLVDCNVRVALDDFGSSLGPLNHLVRLPLDLVKLIASLPRLLFAAAASRRFWSGCSGWRLRWACSVVAQGIEYTDQIHALVRLGCAAGQGPRFRRRSMKRRP